MKVKDLIEELQKQDPNEEAGVRTQEHGRASVIATAEKVSFARGNFDPRVIIETGWAEQE